MWDLKAASKRPTRLLVRMRIPVVMSLMIRELTMSGEDANLMGKTMLNGKIHVRLQFLILTRDHSSIV